jgi:hypothetical protein
MNMAMTGIMKSTVTTARLRALLRRLERLGRQLARTQQTWAEARAQVLRRNAAQARAILVQGV